MKKSKDIKNFLADFEKILEEYMVDKAPFSIPEDIKKLIVDYGPYLLILKIILQIPSVLSIFGLILFLSPFTPVKPSYFYFGFNYTVAMVILGVSLVIEASAISPLLKKEEKGWRLVFYSSLLGLLVSFFYGGVFGGLIAALIFWYVLFQIKDYYR